MTRREFIATPFLAAARAAPIARVAITFDLEMSRNFPSWEDTEWDYTKGLLDDKQSAILYARRILCETTAV